MTRRLETAGHRVRVEYRKALDLYFIVYEDLGVELAPAFDHRLTAQEIAIKAYHGVPFFTMIPTVPINTVYPRPNILMPRIHPVEIELRIV